MSKENVATPAEDLSVSVFCTRIEGGWRVLVAPGPLPSYLAACFDRDGEAYPSDLDFEELDRQLARRSLTLEKRLSKHGSVELTAQGEAAVALSRWLANAFASAIH